MSCLNISQFCIGLGLGFSATFVPFITENGFGDDEDVPSSSEIGIIGWSTTTLYRSSHVLVDLGWVDFDFSVPPSCLVAQPLLPNSHQPKHSQADSGTLEIQVNKTQSQLTWHTLYFVLVHSLLVNRRVGSLIFSRTIVHSAPY